MLDIIKTNVVVPLARRLGTITAAILVGYGITEPLANQVAVGVAAVGAIIGDLFVDWIERRGR